MNNSYVLCGILTGMFATLSIIFLTTKEKDKPCREAFGWLMLCCTVLTAAEIWFCDIDYPDELMGLSYSKDLFILPFFVMESRALINQDLKLLPWKKRWTALLLHEALFVVLIALPLLSGKGWMQALPFVGGATYLLYYYSIFGRRLYLHNKELKSENKKDKEHHLKWITMTIVFNFVMWTMYIVAAITGFDVMYLPYTIVTMLIWLFHAYCLNNQARIDMKRIIATSTVSPIEIIEVTNTEAVRTEKHRRKVLRQKRSIEDSLQMFLMDYPQFATNMQKHAEVKITRKDMTLAMLVCQGMANKEIADILGIGVKSVEVARSRLRSKIGLRQEESLKETLMKHLASM